MARLSGVEPENAPVFIKIAYWYIRRKFGRVMRSAKITALNTKLLRATGSMESGQQALRSLDPVLISLAEIKVATIIGCPF